MDDLKLYDEENRGVMYLLSYVSMVDSVQVATDLRSAIPG